MKRTLSLIMALVMVFSLLPLSAFAAESDGVITFTTDFWEHEELDVGDTFTVTAELSGNPGIASFSMGLDWNERIVKFTGFAVDEDDVLDGSIFASGWTATPNHQTGYLNAFRATNSNKNGELFTANFEVIAGGDPAIEMVKERSNHSKKFVFADENGKNYDPEIDEYDLEDMWIEAPPPPPFVIKINGEEINDIETSTLEGMDPFGAPAEVPVYTVTVPWNATSATIDLDEELEYTFYNSAGYYLGQASDAWGGSSSITVPIRDKYSNPSGVMAQDIPDGELDGLSLQEPDAYSAKYYIMFVYDPADIYNINVESTGSGAVLVSNVPNGSTEITSAVRGSVVYLTFTPDDGYSLKHFSVADSKGPIGADNRFFEMPAEAVTVYAQFAPNITTDYSVAVNKPEHGRVSADVERAAAGTKVNLTVEADEGYELDTLTYTVEAADGETPTPVDIKEEKAFTMPEGNVTISATFKEIVIPVYEITVTEAEHGRVSADVERAAAGTKVNLTVEADEGYELDTLTYTVEAADGETPTPVNIKEEQAFAMPDANVTVSATFAAINYTISTEYNEEQGAVVVTNGSNEESVYKFGDPIALAITPNEGYKVDSVTAAYDNGNAFENISSQFAMPAGNLTIRVTFKQINVIDAEKFEVKHPNIVTVTDEDGNSTMTMELAEGVSETLSSVVVGALPDVAVTQTLRWTSSNEAVAVVNASTGEITAKSSGNTVISIYAEDEVSFVSGDTDPLAAINLTVTAVPAGYTVTMDKADTTVKNGQYVEIPIVVGYKNEEGTVPPEHFNSYELEFQYDAAVLELQNTASTDENNKISIVNDAEKGTVTIRRYGNNVEFGETGTAEAIKLNFATKAMGDAYVKMTSAKVSTSAEALVGDASAAGLLDNVTQITVDGYTVDLPDDFTGSAVADPTKDYAFYINNSNFEYEIQVLVNGSEVSFTGSGTQDAPFKIASSVLNGNIQIKILDKSGKKHAVTITGPDMTGKTGEEAAEYNKDYTATLTRSADHDYDVVIRVGETELELEKDYTIKSIATETESKEEYVIKGAVITDDITITVTKTLKGSVHTITFAGTGAEDLVGGSASVTVNDGESHEFALNKKAGYTYIITVTPKDNYTSLTKTETTNEDGSVTGNYTITNIIGSVTVTINKSDLVLDVKDNYLTLSNNSAMFMIKAEQTLEDDQALMYDGNLMYVKRATEESKKDVWYYLVKVSAESVQPAEELEESGESQIAATLSAEDVMAKITVYTLTENDRVTEFQQSYNVNGVGTVDINDAQLVYDIYNSKYKEFDESATMLKFLYADTNEDGTIDTRDAQSVVTEIIELKKSTSNT